MKLEILYAGECLPYSGQACINAGEKLGLKAGTSSWSFAGDYSIKGCYAYAGGQYKGSYWYGMGTSAEIKGSLDHSDEHYRPEGFDCPKGWILNYEFVILHYRHLIFK